MACDVIALIRQECKEINMIQQQQQQKKAGSASVRVCRRETICFIREDVLLRSLISFRIV